MTATENSKSSLAPYPTPEQREARLEGLAAELGGELQVLGSSVSGRPIRAVRVPCLTPGSEPPRVLVSANIHGVELIASYVALGFLEALKDPDEALALLRQQAEIWVIPSINPDGYARSWERGGVGKLPELRPNDNGVDLNRNYPLPGRQPWFALSLGGWATGSIEPGNAFFKGAAPLSEPETAAMDRFFNRVPLHASANLHSTMGKLIPAHVEDRESFAGYRELCRAFRSAQREKRYRRMASRRLDWFTGEQEDHQHHVHRTWAVCVEVFSLWRSYRQHFRAPSTFWRFNPRDADYWVRNDVPGLTAFFLAALRKPPPKSVVRHPLEPS